MITKAVIPAAGLGTRFLPATKAQPKEMLPVVDKPVIQYVVEEAIANLGIMGRYVLTPAIFDAIEGTPPGKGGEIQLTDAVRLTREREKIYAYVYGGRRYDIGNKLDWIKSNIELALRDERFNNELENFLRTLI